MNKLIASSRYLILMPVLACLLGALVLMVYGCVQAAVETVKSVKLMAQGSSTGIKDESVKFIELVDVFLLATVLYIIGIGLYELFVDKLDLPEWLIIRTLDDLKVKLISVVVTVLSVVFLGRVVNWDGNTSILALGAAVALVIASLTFFVWKQKDGKPAKGAVEENP
jgi:uncharacterized membrane protein YqhA